MPSRFAQHLVSRGLLPSQKVEEALRRRETSGGTLDTALLEIGALPEATLLQALAEITGFQSIHLAEFEANPDMARFIPANVAGRLCAVPLSMEEQTLHVACAYPPPQRALEDVAILLGKKLELWVALEVRVRDWITAVYGMELPSRYVQLLSALEPASPSGIESPAGAPGVAPNPRGRASDARAVAPAHPSNKSARAVDEQPIPLSSPKFSGTASPRNGAHAKAIEEPALTDALSREMAQQIARAVAEEPILLEVRKRPTAEPNDASSSPPSEPREAPRSTPAAAESPRRPAILVPPAGAEWTLAQARAALKEAAHDRDQIIQVALHFARSVFDFAAAFAVVRGAAVGWAAQGKGAEAFHQARPSIPLDSASAFRTVVMTRASYIGPTPQDPLTATQLSQIGRAPRMLFLFPVEVKERLVCILYGDHGLQPISQRRLSELVLFCQDLPSAFQELMLFRKQSSPTPRWALEFEEVVGPRLPRHSVAWSPSAPDGKGTRGRAASTPAVMPASPARSISNFAPLLNKLTGPDAAARASAMAELARAPEASAHMLVELFPGSTAWPRAAVHELPVPDELGPVPAALARLGRAGAQALAPLLDSPDDDIRYFALLTAGSLQYPELVGGVLRGLFDFEPAVSSAARAAASALRGLPPLVASMGDLRLELAAKDPLRRSLAARALGVLHDRDSIDGLINLTGSDDEVCAQAAAEALREITRATHGTDPRRWAAWWAVNRGRSRAQWLVAALRHPELEIRLAAIDELSSALSNTLGYVADGPVAERESAVQKWETAVVQIPRLRNLQ